MGRKDFAGTERTKPASRIPDLAMAGILVSAISFLAATGAGTGTRIGWWNFRQGFKLLNWAAYFGVAGTILSIAGAFLARPGSGRRGFPIALLGVVLGMVSFGVPGGWYGMAKTVPMIHDITTDTENPPMFVSILPLRKDAPNPAGYGGPEIAAKQKAAYPDIRPLSVPLPASETYDTALAAARRMGWEIVDGNPAEGRVEAVATTRWFGFKDDIVVRISQGGASVCRLDVRSVSRVGQSDVGTNARRIRAFLKTFDTVLVSRRAG
jgi:uncharacterized protein (DUF1499 family)